MEKEIGFLLGTLAAWLIGRRFEPPHGLIENALPPGVSLRRGWLIPRVGGLLSRMPGSAAAVALRSTIVFAPGVPVTPALLAHELVHVRQWRQDPLFPLRYVVATLRYGYRDNPYEVEARMGASSTSSNPTDERTSY